MRYWTFERRCDEFAMFIRHGDVGKEIFDLLKKAALEHVDRFVKKIDSNWLRLEIEFKGEKVSRFVDHKPGSPSACDVRFDYMPWRVSLRGPKVGEKLLGSKIFSILPEPLLTLMCLCEVFDPCNPEPLSIVKNPEHRIELIEGRTIIDFDNHISGVVKRVSGGGDRLEVEIFYPESDNGKDIRLYSRRGLLDELENRKYVGQVRDITYLPYIDLDGKVLSTVEEVVESRRLE